jgi:hypothetical protein
MGALGGVFYSFWLILNGAKCCLGDAYLLDEFARS